MSGLLIPFFLAGMSLLYLGLVYGAALSGRAEIAAADRVKLVTTVAEALLVLFLARVLIDWTPLTSWAWVAALGALGGGAALALLRAPRLPWIAARSAGRLRARRVLAPAYAVVLLGLVVLTYATLA